MEPQDNLPENSAAQNAIAAEDMLRVVTEELQSLKDNLLSQLNQDVTHLRAQKTRLEAEIEQMRSQYQQMKSGPPNALSQTSQTDQQQVWAQQLAQILANHLQERLRQQLSQSTAETSQPATPPASESSEGAYRVLSSLDSTFSTTLKTLQQDVSSYQSSLAQQLGRMQTLEQQGEAILEALVNRLKNQLQDAAIHRTVAIEAIQQPPTNQRFVDAPLPVTPVVESPSVSAEIPPSPAIPRSAFNTGLVLILLSSLVLSFQNVVTRVILTKKTVFLFGSLGGFLQPSAGNAVLILLMRMAIVAPLMFVVARFIYPRAWRDIRQLLNRSRRNLLGWVIGSGAALFLSQVLNYMALGNLPTGIATTIFFIYPAVTLLLAWRMFGNRPTYSLTLASLTIYLGVYLTIPNIPNARMGNLWVGVWTAIASGIAFAIYIILTQICAQKLKLHPAPFSAINFITMFVLSALTLELANLFPLQFFRASVPQTMWTPLWIATGILAFTTLIGYLLNNFGIRLIGAAPASIIGTTVPTLTTILAWAFIGENLQPLQLIGIVLVTFWVLGMSIENIQRMTAKKPATASQ